MPRGRAGVTEERRLQIINGALKVFSTRGFLKATNRDVAAAAGIQSPGLIYHYFDSKADLLRAAIEHYSPPIQLLRHSEELHAMPLAEALTQFATTYLALIEDPNVGDCIRVLMAEAMHNPEFGRLLGEIGPMRVWRMLADFFAHKMDTGELRPADPAIVARCFMGPLVMQMMALRVLHLTDSMVVEGGALVSTHVDLFLHGLLPAAQKPGDDVSRTCDGDSGLDVVDARP